MSAPRVLSIDVGNSSVCLGLHAGRRVIRRGRLSLPTREVADAAETVGRELAAFCDATRLDGVGGSSVVPSVNGVFDRLVRDRLGSSVLWVGPGLRLGVDIRYPRPERIGADRLANASAALERYGAPVVVADFGTALTFDIVSSKGAYEGGVIAPGLPLMFDYLAERTALLPKVQPAPVHRVVGKSTEEAMQIGARYGYRGMVREIVDALLARLGPCALCATGGFSRWVLRDAGLGMTIDADLTLRGIARIVNLNRPGAPPP